MEEIVNRIAKSPLVTIDLEDFYPEGNRVHFDLKDWLFEEMILREKDFREALAKHDWKVYTNTYVSLDCSADAIVPAWALLLVTTYLQPYAKRIVKGNSHDLDVILYNEIIKEMDITPFEDKKIIIKGCAHKQIPESAYIQLIERLQPIAASLMYGEACSTVPLIKNK